MAATTTRRIQPEGQRSFDDLGTPLHEVEFAVVDLETTGAAPSTCAITEIGAARYRGGECLGTFQTLVNPGTPIPPMITMLTGITEAMVMPAPRIHEVLPALLEFVGGAVIVGHNIRFDISFLDAALVATDRPRLGQPRVDTVALARRLIRDEVPNLRLGTLARYFRTAVQPTHRALDDALATAEVLHALLERASAYGVTALDDLIALPTMIAHPSAGKLRLTTTLPRSPGVYLFRDGGGRILYVGKATNLRARVRSYFSSDERRKIPQLLRETAAIDHVRCRGPLEAAVLELRLIQHHEPRFNRHAKSWRAYAYLKLTLGERFPRLSVVRETREDGAIYLGPLHSTGAVQRVREAIETVLPLRRCNRRIGLRAATEGAPPCMPAQLGVASCPCTGFTSDTAYRDIVDTACRALTDEPELVIEPLAARMQRLATEQRFEEAAETRSRLAAVARAFRRQRLLDSVRAAERVLVECRDGLVEVRRGALGCVRVSTSEAGAVLPDFNDNALDLGLAAEWRPATPVPRGEVDELLVVAAHLQREAAAGTARVREVAGILALPLPRIPTFDPIEPERTRRRAG